MANATAKPPSFSFTPEGYAKIRWSRRGSCGRRGCTDRQCCCALCDKPIGVAEDDPRWEDHEEMDCDGCELCADRVPIILFKGEGKAMDQAQFHLACFQTILAPAGQ